MSELPPSVERAIGTTVHWAAFADELGKQAAVVEVAHNFHPVVVQPPRAKRAKFPFTGFIDFQGIKIDVENKKGEYRRGKDKDGHEWKCLMHSHYGEIRDTEGTDGDKLDVYVGPNHDSSLVVVVRQLKPDTGAFDEDKVMLGYDSVEEAIGAYKKQYDKPGFYKDGGHKVMPIGEFWRWVHDRENYGKKVAGFLHDLTGRSLDEARKAHVRRVEEHNAHLQGAIRDYDEMRDLVEQSARWKSTRLGRHRKRLADAAKSVERIAALAPPHFDPSPIARRIRNTRLGTAAVLGGGALLTGLAAHRHRQPEAKKAAAPLDAGVREFALHPRLQKALGGVAAAGGLYAGYKYRQRERLKELESGTPSMGRHALEGGAAGVLAGASLGGAAVHKAKPVLARMRDLTAPVAAAMTESAKTMRNSGMSPEKIKQTVLQNPVSVKGLHVARAGHAAHLLHGKLSVGRGALAGAAIAGIAGAGLAARGARGDEAKADLRGEQRRLKRGPYAQPKEAGASPLSAAGTATPSGLVARNKMQKTAPPHYTPPPAAVQVAPSPWTKGADAELPGVGDEGERPHIPGMKQPRLATPRLNPDQGKHIPTNPFRGSWKKLGGGPLHEVAEVAHHLTAAIPEKVKHGILGAGILGAGALGLKATADQVVNPRPEGVGLGAGARAGQKALTLGLSRAGSGPVQY
jgi:hypothetical protein